MKTKLPKSLKRFIRNQKAKIRRGTADSAKQKELIEELSSRFFNKK